MMMPGEQEQIDTVLRIAADIGYGNLICRLQEAWGKMLHDKWQIGDGSPHKWAGHASGDAELPPPGHIITDDGTVRKVLGTLPLTADGCVAIPLVSVVYHPELPEMTLDVDALDDGNKVVGQCGIPMPDYSCQWREYPISECFGSSAEAARAKP